MHEAVGYIFFQNKLVGTIKERMFQVMNRNSRAFTTRIKWK
jgi:hypothetical protein